MSAAKRIAIFAAGILAAVVVADACSWDYPIWSKSRKSDTPLFRFRTNGGTGYIDRDGKVVIPPMLESFGNHGYDDFFDGLAVVRIGGQNWFIDAKGQRRLRAHTFFGRFSEGLTPAMRDHKVGYINKDGRLAIRYAFEGADEFSEGLAAVWVNRRYGYIDKHGAFVIEPRYLLTMPFAEGAARVIEDGPCVHVGYGPCADFNPVHLSNSDAPATGRRDPCQYTFIDRTGTPLFPAKYVEAKDFGEGLAPVGDGRRWGYVDKRGRLAIPMVFENAESFSEGLARVQRGRKWGYIDKTGKLVISAIYDDAHDFSEGLAVVGDWQKNALRYWFIDKTGRQIIPQFFSAASSFVMGRAHVRQGMHYDTSRWSYIDRNGRVIFTYSMQSNPTPANH